MSAKGFIGEFKEFVSRGNVMDLAVGVIIGGAFNGIVSSLCDDVIMPAIQLIISKATGVDDINVSSAVGVKYYNVAGVASDKPFDGMNIVVTRNVDGTVKVQKVMF